MGITSRTENSHVLRWQTGHGRKTRRFTTLTVTGPREEAQRVYDGILAGIGRVKAAPKVFTLKQLSPEYLRYCADQKAIADKRNTVRILECEFGDHALVAINTRLVEQYQAALLSRVSVARCNRILSVLRHMIGKAVDWEMCPAAVADALRKIRQKREPSGRLRYLSAEEETRLLDACSQTDKRAAHLLPIVTFALHTGARLSEILGMRWNDVDMRAGVVTFPRTKNNEKRTVPMNDTVRALLTPTVKPLNGQQRVFLRYTGENLKRIKRSFATALRKAGIGDFRFHDLRHTFASNLVMAGVDLTTVKELLGHKSINMTMRYAHLAPAHKAAAVKLLDRNMVREVREETK
jgi:integrase